jgi:hypothetical protein
MDTIRVPRTPNDSVPHTKPMHRSRPDRTVWVLPCPGHPSDYGAVYKSRAMHRDWPRLWSYLTVWMYPVCPGSVLRIWPPDWCTRQTRMFESPH